MARFFLLARPGSRRLSHGPGAPFSVSEFQTGELVPTVILVSTGLETLGERDASIILRRNESLGREQMQRNMSHAPDKIQRPLCFWTSTSAHRRIETHEPGSEQRDRAGFWHHWS